jgi:hypothetical protein
VIQGTLTIVLILYFVKLVTYPLIQAILGKDNRLVKFIRKLVFYSEIYEVLVHAYIEFLLAGLLN